MFTLYVLFIVGTVIALVYSICSNQNSLDRYSDEYRKQALENIINEINKQAYNRRK